MILRRKVVSLKNIYFNESQWLYTLQIYTFKKSRVEISHTLMNMSLSLTVFTDFFYKDQFNFIFFNEYFSSQPVT